MGKADVLFVASTVGEQDRTKELHLPDALRKFEKRGETLKTRDGLINYNDENNDWKKDGLWIPLADALVKAEARLDDAKHAGTDVFLRGDRGAKGPTYRLRSVEKYEGAEFNYSGEISADLRKLAEDVWHEFGSDNSLTNLGVHVCRKIAGSTSWSQHAWDDAIDFGIGSDMQLGDELYRWLKAHENEYGGFCELLWRVENHYDHIHCSLAPCHTGTPPCA